MALVDELMEVEYILRMTNKETSVEAAKRVMAETDRLRARVKELELMADQLYEVKQLWANRAIDYEHECACLDFMYASRMEDLIGARKENNGTLL